MAMFQQSCQPIYRLGQSQLVTEDIYLKASLNQTYNFSKLSLEIFGCDTQVERRREKNYFGIFHLINYPNVEKISISFHISMEQSIYLH